MSWLTWLLPAGGLWLAEEMIGRRWRRHEAGRRRVCRDAAVRAVVLPDGRRLTYSDRGDVAGQPVIYLHGALGCRGEWPPSAELIPAGVRLLAPERPGLGCADPSPHRTLLTHAADLLHWADTLGLQRFRIIGWSAGCAHALALAYLAPDRIERLDLLGSSAPYDLASGWRNYGLRTMGGVALGMLAPGWMTLILRTVRASPWLFGWAVRGELFTESARLASDPACCRHLISSHGEALRDGPHGFLQELHLFWASWGFPLHRIPVPVTFWHGKQDRVVLQGAQQYLLRTLPRAELRVIPEASHFLPFTHGRLVLEEMPAPQPDTLR